VEYNSLSIVQGRCQGKTSCSLRANNGVFGDPCVGTYKYLQVGHTCETITTINEIVCEGRSRTISCSGGSTIDVINANYGRTADGSVCPHSSIRTTSCSAENSLAKVQGWCQGKTSCTLRANNGVFGDPCVYTYKYLEVDYICT